MNSQLRYDIVSLVKEGGKNISLSPLVSAEFLEDVVVAVKECSDSAFSLSDCQTETLLFSGGCASQQAGWVECRQTGGR